MTPSFPTEVHQWGPIGVSTRPTHLADSRGLVDTVLTEVAQDAVDGLLHLIQELGIWLQVVLDEAVQLIGGDLRQIWRRGGDAGHH